MMRSLVVGLGLLTSACAVGPNFKPPATPSSAAGAFVAARPGETASGALPEGWWRLYNDPVLDGLVAQALANNTDVRVAVANLRRARAVLSETRTQRLPTTTATGSVNYTRFNAFGVGGGGVGGGGAGGIVAGGFEDEIYAVGFDASYEVDLYGRVRRDIEASRADVAAQAAQTDTVRVSVAAETARAYADACSGARQTAVARQSIDVQAQSFDLTERQASAGRGTPLDVARARAQLEQTRATLPQYETARRNALFRLSVLTGRPPAETPVAAAACAAIPQLSRPIPVGDGTALLKRRPDVRQADRNLAAATARIGVATADLYPQISIAGSIGSQALSPNGLTKTSGLRFNVGPLLSWSFPNITVARARIRQAEASTEAALATFDDTVLTALQETETALATLTGEIDRQRSLVAARDFSAEAARIVRLRYGAGAENFLAVLDAERTLADSEAALAASQANVATNQVAVFKALGGGWEAGAAAAAPTVATAR